MIWFSYLIPILAILILLLFFRSKTVWWEYILIVLIPSLLIVVANEIGKKSETTDYEYWNDYLISAVHNEAWDEWVHQTCYRTVSNGKTTTTIPYDCSHAVYHPDQYLATPANGKNTVSISSTDFENFCIKWHKKDFVDMNRHYYTKDGDRYTTSWDKGVSTLEPYMTQHKYENRVQHSRNILNFEEIPKEEAKKLIAWPPIQGRKAKIIINGDQIPNIEEAKQRLYFSNSVLGSIKQIHMMILCYWDSDISIYNLQESYWKGGNKNELTVCIGLSSIDKDSLGFSKVQWVKAMAWANEPIKKEIESYIISNDYFHPISVVDKMTEEVKKGWNRKQFKDFDYIKVEVPIKGIIIINIINFFVTTGLMLFIILNNQTNEIKDERQNRYYNFRRR